MVDSGVVPPFAPLVASLRIGPITVAPPIVFAPMSGVTNRTLRALYKPFGFGLTVTEFVSSNARTFKKPPDSWTITDWKTPAGFFAGSPQTMTADYLLEGATAATGHVFEPYLYGNPHPELLLPAYYKGRNLAESYYLSIMILSWQNVIIGDPLCSLGKP